MRFLAVFTLGKAKRVNLRGLLASHLAVGGKERLGTVLSTNGHATGPADVVEEALPDPSDAAVSRGN